LILNFYCTLNILCYIFILLFFFNLNLFKFSEASYLVNIVYKMLLDDFVIFNLYYIWSNFFYMFIFFFLISLLFFSYKSYFFTSKLFLFFSFISILFFFNALDYFFLNIYSFNSEYFLHNYNTLLNNNINKIHPLLLYGSLFYLFYSTINVKCSMNVLHLNSSILKFVYTLPVCFQYLFFTLFLGSWWAFQEGSWGGWWDWDVSEVFGLYLLINIVKSFHKNYTTITNNNSYLLLTSYLVLLLIFYFFMQLNFSLISHNFNLSSSSNFMSNFIYLIFIIFLLILYSTLFSSSLNSLNINVLTFTYFYNLKLNWTFKTQILFFFNLLVFLSLFPILSSWLWSNFYIEYSFNIINFHDMLVFLFLFLLCIYWSLSPISLFLTLAFLYCNVKFYFLIISSFFFSTQQLLHYFLLWSIVLISLYSLTESSYWMNLNYGFNHVFHSFYNVIKSDSPFIESNKILSETSFRSTNFNWWYDFSSLDFKTFILYFSSTNFFQVFIHDVEDNFFLTSISSIIENSILNLIFSMIFIFFKIKNKKLIIIF
jgi:hypothetical protein